jgi:hypothetical protein
VHLNIAGGKIGIPHRGWTSHHLTLDQHHRFGADRLGASEDVRGRPSGTDRDLYEPVAIPQVEEDDASKVAAPVDPAPQSHALSDVFFSQCAAAMGS